MRIKKLYINGCFPNVNFNLYSKWNAFIYLVFKCLKPKKVKEGGEKK